MSAVVAHEVETRRALLRADLRSAAERVRRDPLNLSAQVKFEEVLDDFLRMNTAHGVIDGSPRWPTNHSFFRSLCAPREDRTARSVLDAWGEELRSTSSGFAGMVVPAYVTELLLGSGHQRRPLCELLGVPMSPSGVTATVSVVDTGADAEEQTVENTALTPRDIDIDDEALPLSTVAVVGSITYQAVQRMAPADLDRVVARELVAAVDARQERSIITGDGTGNGATGLLELGDTETVPLTSTDPADLLDAIAEAASGAQAVSGAPADTVVMSPRRWHALLARAGDYAAAISTASASPAVAGRVLGMDVVASGEVPTTLGTDTDEDVVVVMPRSEVFLGEVPLTARLRPEAAGSTLRASIVVERYFSFGTARPESIHIVSGAGLVDPHG
jgi:HK97 family phage major capsid protein